MNVRVPPAAAELLADAPEQELPPPGRDAIEEIARAHHGSLSHEERTIVEELLKSGQLPCLVATSSLELGIDMGAVDLVIQVESPKSVSRGLQRVGRAGHSLGEVSRGRIFPKFRADLLECAVVAKRMREGAIEETVIPQNPLDVLAQQLVAMAALDEWEIDEVERLVTASEPFHDLSREQLENVLDMLDGRYPRIASPSCARASSGTAPRAPCTAAKALASLVVTNAGTIPDRGLYGVHLPDGRRVGESTRRWSTRPGPARPSCSAPPPGASRTSPATASSSHPPRACPALCPSGRATGLAAPLSWARRSAPLPARRSRASRRNWLPSTTSTAAPPRTWSPTCASSRRATRVVPSDETIVVERFRDEIGDWRLCILSPYGGRVHAAWGLALAAKIRAERDLEADAIWSDDGIVIHLPDADEPPPADLVLIEPDERG